MMAWDSLELDGWEPAQQPAAASPTKAPQAVVARRSARRVVCRVCGRPWIDGECSFMPDDHRRFGAIAR